MNTYPVAVEIKMEKVIKDGKEVIEWEQVDGIKPIEYTFTHPATEWARIDKDMNVTHLDMELCAKAHITLTQHWLWLYGTRRLKLSVKRVRKYVRNDKKFLKSITQKVLQECAPKPYEHEASVKEVMQAQRYQKIYPVRHTQMHPMDSIGTCHIL